MQALKLHLKAAPDHSGNVISARCRPPASTVAHRQVNSAKRVPQRVAPEGCHHGRCSGDGVASDDEISVQRVAPIRAIQAAGLQSGAARENSGEAVHRGILSVEDVFPQLLPIIT